MSNLNSYIDSLTERVTKLAESHAELKLENQRLNSLNVELQRTVDDQKNAISRLGEQNKVAKIAKAVSEDEEDRKEQKRKLNELVREIDKCMALLNN